MKNYNIAIIPGDGIGKDVMEEAIKLLNLITETSNELSFTTTFYEWGCEYYLRNNIMMDDNGLEILRNFDAILFGAVGYPGVPDHISFRELLFVIRQGFNQYVNLRPVKLLPNLYCPLKDKSCEDIDMVFIRENTEGEYSGIGGKYKPNTLDEIAIQTSIFSRKTTEKIMSYAFELARKRNKKNKVSSITKSNALNHSMVMWDEIFKERQVKYNDVVSEQFHVDAAAMYMIQKPEIFDVVVCSNLFGDILTDVGAAIQGGLGFAASANINPEGEYPPLFEPVHGSAPEIAGKNLANPIAMIWSVKLMLDYLGHDSIGSIVMDAITDLVNNKELLTPDQGGVGSTASIGDEICRRVRENI